MLLGILVRFVFLLSLALGHVGLWIYLYNRINASGFARVTIKRIEKLIVIACAVIPILLTILELSSGVWTIDQILDLRTLLNVDKPIRLSVVTHAYVFIAIAFTWTVGPFWILARPQFTQATDRFSLVEQKQNPSMHLKHPEVIRGRMFQRMIRLPGNQIASLECNVKQLLLDDWPEPLDGMRIGHISDIHLTGQMGPEFYRSAIDWLSEQRVDWIVVSGDIVDYAKALELLEPVFGNLPYDMPRYFVLGNHDKRLSEPTQVCERLQAMGWHDVGRRDIETEFRQTKIRVVGNEKPWFHRHLDNISFKDPKTQALFAELQGWLGQPPRGTAMEANPSLASAVNDAESAISDKPIVIGIAHAPDQFDWARRRGCKLVMCGHTHGGQIRLPVIGPIISPSWYGSRYASGVFYSFPTLMHVSRGVSGVHPFRWNCLPETSVLELHRAANNN